MAYIGNQPTIGQYRKLDDISGSFNGSLTAFTMQVGSTNVSAGSVFQLLISLGGVIQEPGTDFTVSGSTITFTTAPAASLSFFGILMGQPLNTATPGDSTVTGAKIVDGTITGGKLAAAFNYDSGLLFLDDTNNRVGIGTTSPDTAVTVSEANVAVTSQSSNVNIYANDALAADIGGSLGLGATWNGTGGLINYASIHGKKANATSGNTDGYMSFVVRDNSGTSERMRIDSSGRLLVGTNASRTVWSAEGSIQQENVNNSRNLTLVNNAANANGAAIVLGKSRGTAVGDSDIVNNDDILGWVAFAGADGTDINALGASIAAVVDGTPANNSVPGSLVFATTRNGGASPTDRITITEKGEIQNSTNQGSNCIFRQIARDTGNSSETFTSLDLGMNDNCTALINISLGGTTNARETGGALIYWTMPRTGTSSIQQTIVTPYKDSGITTFSVSVSSNSLVVSKDSDVGVFVTVIGGGGTSIF